MIDFGNLQSANCKGPEAWMILAVPGAPERKCRVKALIDTGAVVSSITEADIRRLGEKGLVHRAVRVRGATGSELRPAYQLEVGLDGLELVVSNLPVVYRRYAVIGRDVLNTLHIEVNGPKETGVVHQKGSFGRSIL